MSLRLCAVLLTALLSACARDNHWEISEAELLARRGQPVITYSMPQRPEAHVLGYEGEEYFQVEGSRVRSRMREPVGVETNLQYWRYWHVTYGQRLAEAGSGMMELRIPGAGRTVIYQTSTNQVIRIVEYAPIR